jgi:hypothetical protein
MAASTALKATLVSVAAASLGFALGFRVGSSREDGAGALAAARAERDASAAAALRTRLEEAEAGRESLGREAEALRREVERLRGRGERSAPGGSAPGAPAPADRAAIVEELVAAARAAVGRGDGAAALAAVRALASALPEGGPPAMALVAEIAEDREALRVGDAAWVGFLGDPAVTGLLARSLGRPSPEAFREIAADSLPSLLPPEALIACFAEALRTEEDEDVQRSMVEGLAALSLPGAEAVLAELLGDARVPTPVRVRIATHLSLSGQPEAAAALRAAAEGAPPALAAGIRAALSAKELPEGGFLVTGFVGGTLESRGLEVGDLLLSYDGRPAAEGLDAAVRDALERDGFVKVEVLRGGTRRTLEVRPGWLGLIGRVAGGGRGR